MRGIWKTFALGFKMFHQASPSIRIVQGLGPIFEKDGTPKFDA